LSLISSGPSGGDQSFDAVSLGIDHGNFDTTNKAHRDPAILPEAGARADQDGPSPNGDGILEVDAVFF
jgi:hypothetical protein